MRLPRLQDPVLRKRHVPVAPRDLRIDGEEIRFPIARSAFVPGGEQRLWWACSPLGPLAEEERRLGMAFRSMRFETRP